MPDEREDIGRKSFMTTEWNWDVSVSIFPASPPKIGTLPGFIVYQVYLNPDSAVRVTESARHNLSAAKSTSLCLSAFITALL